MSAKDLLTKYTEAVGRFPTNEQKLLLTYFAEAGDNLPVDVGYPDGFCKAFRTRSVCQHGWQDLVVWALITSGACDKIWNVLEDYYGS